MPPAMDFDMGPTTTSNSGSFYNYATNDPTLYPQPNWCGSPFDHFKTESVYDDDTAVAQHNAAAVFALSPTTSQQLLPSFGTSENTVEDDQRSDSDYFKEEDFSGADGLTEGPHRQSVPEASSGTLNRVTRSPSEGSITPPHQSAHRDMNDDDEDDDDDLQQIDPATASEVAQQKWSLNATTHRMPNVEVKQESGHIPEPSGYDKMLAQQRDLLERSRPRGLPSGTVFEMGLQVPAAQQEHPLFSSAMHASSENDDNAWMQEAPEVDEEYKSLTNLREALLTKQQNGRITNIEQMELYKIKNSIALEDRLRQAQSEHDTRNDKQAIEEEDEDTLFLPDDTVRNERTISHTGQGEQQKNDSDEDALAATIRGLQDALQPKISLNKSGRGPAKTRQKSAKNAREHIQAQRDKERSKAQRKKTREAATAKAKKKPTRVAKPSSKVSKKRQSSKQKPSTAVNTFRIEGLPPINGRDDVAEIILQHLISNDAIADRLTNPSFQHGPEPEIFAGTKITQLQQLIASVPEGSSKQAKSDQRKLLEASKAFGHARVRAENGRWTVKGMCSPLYHHQLLGAQWMVKRELCGEKPHGGLVADDMGLGKTVQMLACMVGNPPCLADNKRGIRATLIVVPSSIIEQWMDEIRVHAEHAIFKKVLVYTTRSRLSFEVLADCDIVVTSYSEVMRQFPYPDRRDRASAAFKKDMGAWYKAAEARMGVLHRINWYRVVLDEAHAIKNNTARTSLACQNLKGVFRWCMTGTPLLNRLEELFPYLRFLKANYSMNWETFRVYFCDPDEKECALRMATLLSYTMMKRTMSTTILGRPVITLPTPHPIVRYVDFSLEEKVIYRITENRFRCNLNVFLANGTARKAYGLFFVQLLRLRQCTSHPFMLERTIKESWTSEDVTDLSENLERLGRKSQELYKQCKLWVAEGEQERTQREAQGEGSHDATAFGISDFGKFFRFDKAIASLDTEEMFNRVTCRICYDMPQEPMITDCNHIFCKECLDYSIRERAATNDASEDFFVCPHCNSMFLECRSLQSPLSEDPDNTSSVMQPGHRGRNAKSGRNAYMPPSKGLDAMGFEPKSKDSTWITRSDDDLDDLQLAPSAKTTALKATLLRGFDEAPLDKVVIYVQFRLLARIVGRICNKEGWGFLYLTGDSSLEHRSHVVKNFRDDVNIKILVAGLKCGGLGLNFPFANRCITLDLWWNFATESQAFGRIFRLGQTKETWMTRIIIKNTVDMRLLAMQAHKLRTLSETERVAEEGLKQQLSMKELASLFGFLRTDEDDNIVSIEADYDDTGIVLHEDHERGFETSGRGGFHHQDANIQEYTRNNGDEDVGIRDTGDVGDIGDIRDRGDIGDTGDSGEMGDVEYSDGLTNPSLLGHGRGNRSFDSGDESHNTGNAALPRR